MSGNGDMGRGFVCAVYVGLRTWGCEARAGGGWVAIGVGARGAMRRVAFVLKRLVTNHAHTHTHTRASFLLLLQHKTQIRPHPQLDSSKREMLGSLEQCFMSIRCPDGGHGGSPGLAFTHAELGAGAMLSVVASLTPYSDFNQSPRNMYQCQVGAEEALGGGGGCRYQPKLTGRGCGAGVCVGGEALGWVVDASPN